MADGRERRRLSSCRRRRPGVPSAVLVLGLASFHGTRALQCYTTPDFPCEVDKGYAGGCIEDIGVLITCTEPGARCKTIMRNGQPAYYFVNKSCDPFCKSETTPLSEGKKNSKGTTIRETIDCCDEDLCNDRNLPFEQGGGRRRHASWLDRVLVAISVFMTCFLAIFFS
eukprot:Tamp_30653.p1 GENE.Tamp_30653~~Tamp_30653.p1  ORF type:complete len:182 (+),score=21.80 Tamp_30653:41-547(+)